MLLWLLWIITWWCAGGQAEKRHFMMHSQFQNGESRHAVPIILALELSIEVVVQEGEVVWVVPVYPRDESIDVLWACGRVVGSHCDEQGDVRCGRNGNAGQCLLFLLVVLCSTRALLSSPANSHVTLAAATRLFRNALSHLLTLVCADSPFNRHHLRAQGYLAASLDGCGSVAAVSHPHALLHPCHYLLSALVRSGSLLLLQPPANPRLRLPAIVVSLPSTGPTPQWLPHSHLQHPCRPFQPALLATFTHSPPSTPSGRSISTSTGPWTGQPRPSQVASSTRSGHSRMDKNSSFLTPAISTFIPSLPASRHSTSSCSHARDP